MKLQVTTIAIYAAALLAAGCSQEATEVAERFALIWSEADVTLTSSQF